MTDMILTLVPFTILFGLAALVDVLTAPLAYALGLQSYWTAFFYERWPVYLRLVLLSTALGILAILMGWST